ncbi:MAG: hypothetical protein KDB82_07700 [Planctomycetes bacterium]|nr:hypothetical protein [Planctomycetota bacterium]
MKRTIWLLAITAAVALLALPNAIDAQRGPGKGGKGGKGGYKGPNNNGKGNGPGGGNANKPWGKDAGKQKLPELKIEDLKADGEYNVYNLLPTTGEQPRIGVTSDKAYRLISYDVENQMLKFVTVDLISGSLGSETVKLPSDAPKLGDEPRMAFDAGEWCVITNQAATLFVDPFKGKVKVAAGLDSSVAEKAPEPPKKKGWGKDKEKPSAPPEQYRVHGGPGGKFALSVLVKYDKTKKQYTGSGATLHFADDRSIDLKWDHAKYGIPPKDRDAVCAVTDSEIVVLVTNPRTPGAFSSACTLSTLVFDRKGNLKEAQTDPEAFAGNNAPRFTLSPDGQFFVAHPEDGMHPYVIKRGSWERGYKTDYYDACVGFAPEGKIGVFLENKTPERAALKAIELATGKELWATTVTHEEAGGDGDKEPFTSVGPEATVVAAQFGVLQGVTSDEPTWLYHAKAIDFEPLCMSYDDSGKKVAVLALDRVFVLDAKTREEINSIPFEKPLTSGTLGEFVTFDSKGKKILACARNKGVWLIDLGNNTIEKSLPPIPGTWARAMPDFSGVVYSQPKEEGGNVMLQKLGGGDPERVYRCEYKDTLAVCFWISEKGDEFLVAEREVGEGRLFLINDEGEKIVTYNVTDADTMYVGDNAITGFVTRRKQVVLINEVNKWSYTGINCTVIGPEDSGEAIETSFSAVFKSEELPGRSTYGATAASPFFGGLYAGDERNCKFACPAGVLDIDVGKNEIVLQAWSRSPTGLAAVNPKGKEFFVAGSSGLKIYKLK